MKKITLALVLLTFGVQAQDFPSPYCDMDDTSVEEITSVEFAGSSITNTDFTSILVDETATIAEVTQEETYTLTVEGNTIGNFENNIVAFIDWNQNEVLDDEGEIYEIGSLINTTGDDGTVVSMDITVPVDALEGPTRIRITKTYTDEDSVAIINPCAIEFDPFGQGANPSFGQALDFTLNIEANDAFPSPYCDIEDSPIEEITTVDFAESSITNTDFSSILVDQTATIAEVSLGETYTIMVGGNTYGDFQNKLVAFIDWNQNELLDDPNEIYEIGDLINSDGTDGTVVSMDISVPADALEGTTRIRITKTYEDPDSVAIINPCAIEFDPFGQGANPGIGQALDFTLEVGSLKVNDFDTSALSVYPIPAKDLLNVNYKTNINSVKVYNLLGQEVISQNKAAPQIQIDVSTLSAGAYIVKISTEEGLHNFKMVKQ